MFHKRLFSFSRSVPATLVTGDHKRIENEWGEGIHTTFGQSGGPLVKKKRMDPIQIAQTTNGPHPKGGTPVQEAVERCSPVTSRTRNSTE